MTREEIENSKLECIKHFESPTLLINTEDAKKLGLEKYIDINNYTVKVVVSDLSPEGKYYIFDNSDNRIDLI